VVRCAIHILERQDLQVHLCSTVTTLLVVVWEPHIPRHVNPYSPTIPDPCPSSIESTGAYFYFFILITYYSLVAYYMGVGARFHASLMVFRVAPVGLSFDSRLLTYSACSR